MQGKEVSTREKKKKKQHKLKNLGSSNANCPDT